MDEKIRKAFWKIGTLFSILGYVFIVGTIILFFLNLFLGDAANPTVYNGVLGLQHLLSIILLILVVTHNYHRKLELITFEFGKFSEPFAIGSLSLILGYLIFWVSIWVQNALTGHILSLIHEIFLVVGVILQFISWIRFKQYAPFDPKLSVRESNWSLEVNLVWVLAIGTSLYLFTLVAYVIVDFLEVLNTANMIAIGVIGSLWRNYTDLFGILFFAVVYITFGNYLLKYSQEVIVENA
jgi:hypothetical protein